MFSTNISGINLNVNISKNSGSGSGSGSGNIYMDNGKLRCKNRARFSFGKLDPAEYNLSLYVDSCAGGSVYCGIASIIINGDEKISTSINKNKILLKFSLQYCSQVDIMLDCCGGDLFITQIELRRATQSIVTFKKKHANFNPIFWTIPLFTSKTYLAFLVGVIKGQKNCLHG